MHEAPAVVEERHRVVALLGGASEELGGPPSVGRLAGQQALVVEHSELRESDRSSGGGHRANDRDSGGLVALGAAAGAHAAAERRECVEVALRGRLGVPARRLAKRLGGAADAGVR